MKMFFRKSGVRDLKNLFSYAKDLRHPELLRFYLAYSRSSNLNKKIKQEIREKILA